MNHLIRQTKHTLTGRSHFKIGMRPVHPFSSLNKKHANGEDTAPGLRGEVEVGEALDHHLLVRHGYGRVYAPIDDPPGWALLRVVVRAGIQRAS